MNTKVINMYEVEAERNRINATFKTLVQNIEFAFRDAKAKNPPAAAELNALLNTVKGEVRSEQLRQLNGVKTPKVEHLKNQDYEIL